MYWQILSPRKHNSRDVDVHESIIHVAESKYFDIGLSRYQKDIK
jgi:hypothetical protein